MDDERTPIPDVCAFHPGCIRRIEQLETHADVVRMGLVEAVGRSGRNGRLGHLEQTVRELEDELKRQRSLISRIVIAVLAAASGGSGISYALLRALGG